MDGVRPDAIAQTDTPVLDRLVREGAYTWKGRSVMPSVTLPCHTSMFRGVEPARHGINTNQFHPLVRPVPSIFDVASAAGVTTGFCYNWEQLRDLADPGSLNVSFHYVQPNVQQLREKSYRRSEPEQIAHFCRILEAVDVELLFLYIGSTDAVGHAYGWMSEEYLQAITHADQMLGIVLDKMKALGRDRNLHTIVQSDHGGHEKGHGTDSDEDMTIPWIVHGPSVKPGHEITMPVVIYDTCVTIAHLLGLPMNDQWEGKVITDAFCG